MVTINEDRPDLVVGVDFGMTFTGVAWTNLISGTQSISDWPGLIDAHESKVPTKLTYNRNGAVSKWGFLCDNDDDDSETDELHECFKIFLDQESIDGARKRGLQDIPATVEEAARLITDYLRQVYGQVKRSIEANTGSWNDMRVEFIFSLPTTWQALSITSDFEKAIKAAGFGEENPYKHVAKLELTEAEAAAVFVVTTPAVRLASGDILLVCDAGGGTTDLGLLEVIDPNPNMPSLKQVAAVKGVGIGSTMIDRAFQNLVQGRLNNHPEVQSMLPRNLALKLARSTAFRAAKHGFGTGLEHPEYRFALGYGINQDFNHPGLRIERGRMVFSRAEIQALFDNQIRGIIRRIDEQLEWMRTNRSGQSVRYLVLSGGLGGSPYVKTQLERKYSSTNITIIRSQEPRLSVVKGLVMDRKQRLVSGTAALKTRIARASYGVLCRQLYNPEIHVNADVQLDFYNKGQKWAINQIDWLIKKGDTIDTDSAREKEFTKKINPGDPGRKWDTTIIISHNDRGSLPRMLKQAGALKLCDVQSDLKEVQEREFELKNKRCWQGKRYYNAKFTIRVIIAPADLKFELWFKNTKYNRSHEAVSIEWDQAGASARPPTRQGENDNWESHPYRPAPGRFKSH